jgi:N-acetylmuramic acid 6-phosphate etherase
LLNVEFDLMKHKPATDTAKLDTEQRNAASRNLDQLSSLQIASIMNAEDAKVARAVKKALPQIAQAIDAIADALLRGGRLIYVGAGTSGRIGALDAAECPPTFNLAPDRIRFVMAGGEKALGAAIEADEDSRPDGRDDLARHKPTRRDVVVGIAASGRTPYTVAALEYARSKGAKIIAIACNRGTPLERAADIGIVVETGPEVLTGSTRMKAGTAQKMVVNMLSTGAMARIGLVYENLMINVHLKNSKLAERGIRIVMQAAGLGYEASVKALDKAGGSVQVAIVMSKSGLTRAQAEKRLRQTLGVVGAALK